MGKVMWTSGSDTIGIVDADSTITIPGNYGYYHYC